MRILPVKLQIKTTFSFSKLAKNINSILKGTSSTIAKQWETETLNNIDNQRGRVGEKLADNTPFTIRLKGHSKVMVDTESLLTSIRAKGDTLSMNGYGWDNHVGIKRPKRPFIGFAEGHPNYDKNSKEVFKTISKDIGKALKK